MKEFDFSQNLNGVGVVLRAELNVPIESGKVSNTFRIDEAVPTIARLAERGARTVVVAHIGREKTDSLRVVFDAVKARLRTPLFFADAVVGERAVKAAAALKNGETLLLENVRREAGETENNPAFAEKLAAYGSFYINDAFPASHRAHASIVGIPKFIPGFVGPAFMKEFHGIAPALDPEKPNIAIVGGAKFDTKEPLVRTLLEKYDHVFIGGALAHDFFLARGLEIGKSLASRTANLTGLSDNLKILTPVDVVVSNPSGTEVKEVEDIAPEDMILDAGPKSLELLESFVAKAKFILWNGPLGNFEKGFSEGTEHLAKSIAASSGHSVVGGGDTVAAIEKLKLNSRFTHVSTAGGAMLDFIANGTLPGIEALS